MSLFDALKIATEKTENTSWIRNVWQKNDGPKISSVERPTLSKALLDTEAGLQNHKGKMATENGVQFYFQIEFIANIAVSIDSNGDKIIIEVPGGHQSSEIGQQFIDTNYQNYLLTEIIQSYAVGDVCLIGPKGSGKSILVSQIAHTLNQSIEPMVLYQDMTARDFVQQRTTTADGDTVWRDSPLIRAAKTGGIAVLDGIHRIHSSTISVLHR